MKVNGLMVIDRDNLPDDVSLLQKMVIHQLDTIRVMTDTNEALQKQVETQNEQIAKLTEAIISLQNKIEKFLGKKSEKKEKPQPQDTPSQEKKKRAKNGGGGRNELLASLPRTEVVVDVPEEERVCPECGTPFKHIDNDRTELLIFVPMKLEVLVQIRPKYVTACDCCGKRSASQSLRYVRSTRVTLRRRSFRRLWFRSSRTTFR